MTPPPRCQQLSGIGSRITPIDHFSLCLQPVLQGITLAGSAFLIEFKGANLDFMFKYRFLRFRTSEFVQVHIFHRFSGSN
jgi:hypothetical protein